ncbi:MAG: hypothetical protein J1G01_03930 [Clostridiales bacterium]|nr:hypothetical protein [Clostridiales bacterium]
MDKNNEEMIYEDREALDGELNNAIAEILSAEEQAKHTIAKAEETVKAVQLDGATRERDMKENSNKIMAKAHDEAISAAEARAVNECNRRIAAAEKKGEELIKSKQKQITERVNELYAMLEGK